jgi:hypothetical protein
LRFPQDPVLYLHDRYPDFAGTLPNKNPALANNQNTNYIARDSNRLPYVQNYSFGFEFQLPASSVVEINFIGNKGTRLLAPGLDNLNQLPVNNLALGDALIDPLSARPGAAPAPYAGFNGTVAQALRPFPQYQNITQKWPNFGTSDYNSLQISYSRHFTRGLAINGNYTWSKAIGIVDDTGVDGGIQSQDVFNRLLERSIEAFNVPHNVKLGWIYELPFGPGKHWLASGLMGKVLGGWTVTGVQQYRSGDALQITTSGLRGTAIFNGAFRPDLVPGIPIVIDQGQKVVFSTGAGTQYLNPAAFAQVPRTANNVPLRLGTAPRYLPSVRGPASFNEDFGLVKKFAFTEQKSLEFRGDFANAFNRAGRGNPVTDITSPLFGRITGAQKGPRNIQLGARFVF